MTGIGQKRNPAWSPENNKLLISLWNQGISAGKISQFIPGSTRSSIMGRVRRMGLPFRKTVVAKPGPVKQPKVVAIQKKVALPIPPLPKAPEGDWIPFMEAGPTTCRSIEGSSLDANGRVLAVFCSNPKHPEASYCSYHQGIFYQPNTRRVK